MRIHLLEDEYDEADRADYVRAIDDRHARKGKITGTGRRDAKKKLHRHPVRRRAERPDPRGVTE